MSNFIDSTTAVQAAKLLSFPAAFFAAGYGFSASQNNVNHIFDVRPQISTPIFKAVFNTGATVVVPLTVVSASASAYLAYQFPEKRKLYGTAAVTMITALPWTALVMMPGIQKLIAISDGGADIQAKSEMTLEHRQLLIRWVRHNYIRASFFFVSAVTGLWATLTA